MAGHFYNGRELELLIPASSLEVLKTAVIFGADAVYIGGEAFGLRAKAKNFSMEDMKEGIAFAHAHDVKVYVTANILAHNYDLEGDAMDILKELDGTYDFIFMDAAKGQYINFLPELLRLMPAGGLLISDNVLQEGDIVESRYGVTRRNRTIHTRMREYIYTLTHAEQLETSIVPIGDGITLSVKKG